MANQESPELVITDSASPISFRTSGGGHWPIWDRYIAIDGQPAVHIGNICGTCSFFFQRLDGAKSVGVAPLVASLNAGVSGLDQAPISALRPLLPDGRYRALLLRVVPNLVRPGGPGDYFAFEQVDLWGLEGSPPVPHDPKTEYYRLGSHRLEGRGQLFQFLVPTFASGSIQPERVAEYEAALRSGTMPTAVAISVLDVKEPADWEGDPEVTAHWCLAHYLLDGHHKILAASRVGLPCTLISFLAIEEGISSESAVSTLLGTLKEIAPGGGGA